MTRNMIFAVTLASATALAPAAFAASSNNSSSQGTTNSASSQAKPVKQAVRDYTRLSRSGFNAFHDIRLARLAIFDGQAKRAEHFVSSAEASWQKAENDRTSFMKAVSDIHAPQNQGNQNNASADMKGQNGTQSAKNGADNSKPIKWVPIDAEVNLAKGYLVTPQNSKAVAKANQSMRNGDRKGAMDSLKLAGIDVNYTMALAPVNQTETQLQAAAKDLNANKYYEANLDLKKAEDGIMLDQISVVGNPNAQVSSSNGSDNGQSTQSAQNGSDQSQSSGTADQTTTSSTSSQ
ncbi:YfdX family protein [Jiella sp. M17.18]|uniref:YfdX family protein n=1 Tax=Jiella sp. M17.18 TaxID=3234247 RepID=UPI0034DEDD8D